MKIGGIASFLLITLNSYLCIEPQHDIVADPEAGVMRDGFNRQRLFHGMNTVVKLPPYLPNVISFDSMNSLVDDDFKLLQSMGMNVIRVNVPWKAVEPTRRSYDEKWLSSLEDLVNAAGRYGIYSLLDMHQDAFSEKFCGTGFPDWAVVPSVNDFPEPLAPAMADIADVRYPNREECDSINDNHWPMYYVTYAESSAYGEFFGNASLKTSFASFWRHVAKRFATNDYVLGYELMNEPFVGDVWKNPTLFVPAIADRLHLQPLYDEVAAAIRGVDPNKLIFFESPTWEILGLGEQVGFDHVPGGAQWSNRSVISFHNSVDSALVPDSEYYDIRRSEAKRLGCVAAVTETGADQLKALDDHLLSYMHWDYKWFSNWTWDNPGLFLVSEDGRSPCPQRGDLDACLNRDEVRTWARVYPQAVAGAIESFSFDPTSASASLRYMPQQNQDAASASAPTELFVPTKWWYPEGFSVTVMPEGAATWQASGDVVEIIAKQTSSVITITIERKASA